MWNIAVARYTHQSSDIARAGRNPQKGWNCHSLGSHGLGMRGVCGYDNYSSIIPLFNPIIAACVRSLAPNLERMHLTRLLTVSSVIES